MTTLTSTRSTDLLRRVLLLDGVASGALGVLLAAAAGPLQGLLGAPIGVPRAVGVFFIGYGVVVAVIGTRQPIPRPAAWVVAVGNVGWVLASVAVAIADPWSLTPLGTAFVLAQALVVAGFAEFQVIGLRRRRR